MIKVDPRNPRGIVWLASYPKSGNTWLRMFLYQLGRIRSGKPREADAINKVDLASPYEAGLVPLFERQLGKPLAGASSLEMMRVRSRVQAQIAAQAPGLILVKTHLLLGAVNNLPTINAAISSGAVYVVRDPRDVAPSLANHRGLTIDGAIELMNTRAFATPNSSEGAGEPWGSWSENVLSWTAAGDSAVLIVRYEDMLAKAPDVFGAVVNHLRQPSTPAQIAEAIELSSFDTLKRQEEQFGFVGRPAAAERFFLSGKAGGWREKLSETQATAIVGAHREQMRRFGYLGSAQPGRPGIDQPAGSAGGRP